MPPPLLLLGRDVTIGGQPGTTLWPARNRRARDGRSGSWSKRIHVHGQEGGELIYHGIEGDHTFRGKKITRLDSDLGTLLTVVLQANGDAGGRNFTLVVPKAFGVTRQQPVTFGTLGIKTTTRGFIATPA